MNFFAILRILPNLVLGFRIVIILFATLEDSPRNYISDGVVERHATSITKWLDLSQGINNVGQFTFSFMYIVLIKIPFSVPVYFGLVIPRRIAFLTG